MEKLCTNKNHSYKHNEQINKQNAFRKNSIYNSHLSKVFGNVKKIPICV